LGVRAVNQARVVQVPPVWLPGRCKRASGAWLRRCGEIGRICGAKLAACNGSRGF
jgi:hypothetical protein